MKETAQFPIGADWMYAVRTACQEFHNRVLLVGDRRSFQHALAWLGQSTPAPGSIQEADALKNLLKSCSLDAGILFHQAYHARIGDRRCIGSPVESSIHVWAAHEEDPRTVLSRWSRTFFSVFDTTHPLSLAERATLLLRERIQDPPGLGELARLLGSSRSVVARSLYRDLGMARGEYLTRLRLQSFITEARKPRANLTRLAEAAGYRSYHNLVGALRRRTGLAPREMVRLSDDELAVIMESKLAVAPAPLYESRCPSSWIC